MGLFSRLFGRSSKEKSKEISETGDVDVLEFENLDEKFAGKFNEAGGKILLCDSLEDAKFSVKNIINENNWSRVVSFNTSLTDFLSKVDTSGLNDKSEDRALITNCESLLADDGSILTSSNQTKGFSLVNLPKNFIVLARISDITNTKSDGMTNMISRYKGDFPSSITTIRGPRLVAHENNIDYGSEKTSKNIYLLLFE